MAMVNEIFMRINSREDALIVSRSCGNGFLALAAAQALGSFFFSRGLLVDAVIFAICGFFIREKQSRVAAAIAGVLAGLAVITTVVNFVSGRMGGAMNLIVTVILVIAARRSLEATFKLHGRFGAPSNSSAGAQGTPN